MPISADAAETLALNLLTWLVSDQELLAVFMGSTGISHAELSERANDRDFMIALLDFLMLDDAWVVAFCDAGSMPYDQPYQARLALMGGEDVHWT